MRNKWCLLQILCLALSLWNSGSPSPAAVTLSAPLEEARSSVQRMRNWKFQPDKTDDGFKKGWADPSFDDTSWQKMDPYKPWQDQGFKDHHGIAWYRLPFNVPGTIIR